MLDDQRLLARADIGSTITVRLDYRDASGFDNQLVRMLDVVVGGVDTVTGSAAAEWLGSNWAADIAGLGGNDTLTGSSFEDHLDGGEGDDLFRPVGGADTLVGGPGWDTLAPHFDTGEGAHVDLAAGIYRSGGVELVLSGIEAVVGTTHADNMSGRDQPGFALGEVFATAIGAGDRIDGRGGIDAVHLPQPRADMVLARSGNTITVANRYQPDVQHTLIDVERIRFHDIYLAFGARAEEVAQVAFALWSKGIAAHPYLFGRGISYYDVGYSFDELIGAAVGFFVSDSDQQFAERLAGNVASGRSAAELLTLMQANGGAGPGQAGRAFATKLVAQHPDNMNNIELAGFVSNGIPCALYADGVLLFAPIGG